MAAFPAVAALLVFILVIIAIFVLVLFTGPISVNVPRTTFQLHISYAWMPVLGTLLMLICQCITFRDVGKGLTGDDRICPYGVMILFMSLAYMAASLDMTGMFAFLSLRMTSLSRGNGRLLFFIYYALSSVITTLTSNDVSIMTLTPIICYHGKATNMDPTPYLVAEFAASNLWSMLLFYGNPTNIIVSDAYDMTVLGYTKWTILPTLTTSLVCAAMLYFIFKPQLPERVQLPEVDASIVLNDRLGAWLGSANLAVCLILLIAAPSLKWDMWLITLICALVQAWYNFVVMVALKRVKLRRARSFTTGSDPWAMELQPLQPHQRGKQQVLSDEEIADDILSRDDSLSIYYRQHKANTTTITRSSRAKPGKRPGMQHIASLFSANNGGAPQPLQLQQPQQQPALAQQLAQQLGRSATQSPPLAELQPRPSSVPPVPRGLALSRLGSISDLQAVAEELAMDTDALEATLDTSPAHLSAGLAAATTAAVDLPGGSGWRPRSASTPPQQHPGSVSVSDWLTMEATALGQAPQPLQPHASGTFATFSLQSSEVTPPPAQPGHRTSSFASPPAPSQQPGGSRPCSMTGEAAVPGGVSSPSGSAPIAGDWPLTIVQVNTPPPADHAPPSYEESFTCTSFSDYRKALLQSIGQTQSKTQPPPQQQQQARAGLGLRMGSAAGLPSPPLRRSGSLPRIVEPRRKSWSGGSRGPSVSGAASNRGSVKVQQGQGLGLGPEDEEAVPDYSGEMLIVSRTSGFLAPGREVRLSRPPSTSNLPGHGIGAGPGTGNAPGMRVSNSCRSLACLTAVTVGNSSVNGTEYSIDEHHTHMSGSSMQRASQALAGAVSPSGGLQGAEAVAADSSSVVINGDAEEQALLAGFEDSSSGAPLGVPDISAVLLKSRAVGFIASFTCLPWEVVPFALGMFVLVEGLAVQGFIEALAEGLGKASDSLGAAIMLMGWLSVLLCNVINNQPMTILLTRVCMSEAYVTAVGSAVNVKGALFALIVGSNLGANITLIGALAGIMWAGILKRMQVQMSYKTFLLLVAPTGIGMCVTAFITLWVIFAWWT